MAIAARFHALLNSIGKSSDAERVRTLKAEVAQARRRVALDEADGQEQLVGRLAERLADPPLTTAVAELAYSLLGREGYFSALRDIAEPTTAQLWDTMEALQRQRTFLTNLDGSLDLIAGALESVVPAVAASNEPTLFRSPLHAQIRDFPEYLDGVVGTFLSEEIEELLPRLREQLLANLALIDPKQIRLPSRSSIAEPRKLIDSYLHGTPLVDFLDEVISLPVSDEVFFSHMHVVGGSGAGKTQWLSAVILHHLGQEDPPALVVVDSQGDLIDNLSHLAVFDPEGGALADRLVLITPKDIAYPPSINIFDINRGRLEGYDQATREQVVAGVIQTFDYLFTGLLGADLTAKQTVFFRFVARLMLALPETMGRNATILDMIDLMDDHTRYAEAIASLPAIQRRFFERDFPTSTFKQTKEQIRYRLNAILENPTLERLFTSPTTKVDLFDELNRGSIILIDTAKDFLKGASANFGRIFISLVLQAALERAAIPERDRRAAFLIVDEAAEYFDSNIDDLLTEARKYRLGCVFAHQFLEQCTRPCGRRSPPTPASSSPAAPRRRTPGRWRPTSARRRTSSSRSRGCTSPATSGTSRRQR